MKSQNANVALSKYDAYSSWLSGLSATVKGILLLISGLFLGLGVGIAVIILKRRQKSQQSWGPKSGGPKTRGHAQAPKPGGQAEAPKSGAAAKGPSTSGGAHGDSSGAGQKAKPGTGQKAKPGTEQTEKPDTGKRTRSGTGQGTKSSTQLPREGTITDIDKPMKDSQTRTVASNSVSRTAKKKAAVGAGQADTLQQPVVHTQESGSQLRMEGVEMTGSTPVTVQHEKTGQKATLL